MSRTSFTERPPMVIPEEWVPRIAKADLSHHAKHAALTVAWLAMERGLPLTWRRSEIFALMAVPAARRAVCRGLSMDERRAANALIELRDRGFLTLEERPDAGGRNRWHAIQLNLPGRM